MRTFSLEDVEMVLEQLAGTLYGFSDTENADCPLTDDGLLTPGGKLMLRTAAPLAMEVHDAVWAEAPAQPDEATMEVLIPAAEYARALRLALRYLGEHAGEVEDEAGEVQELYWGVHRHLKAVRGLQPSPEPMEVAS